MKPMYPGSDVSYSLSFSLLIIYDIILCIYCTVLVIFLSSHIKKFPNFPMYCPHNAHILPLTYLIFQQKIRFPEPLGKYSFQYLSISFCFYNKKILQFKFWKVSVFLRVHTKVCQNLKQQNRSKCPIFQFIFNSLGLGTSLNLYRGKMTSFC